MNTARRVACAPPYGTAGALGVKTYFSFDAGIWTGTQSTSLGRDRHADADCEHRSTGADEGNQPRALRVEHDRRELRAHTPCLPQRHPREKQRYSKSSFCMRRVVGSREISSDSSLPTTVKPKTPNGLAPTSSRE